MLKIYVASLPLGAKLRLHLMLCLACFLLDVPNGGHLSSSMVPSTPWPVPYQKCSILLPHLWLVCTFLNTWPCSKGGECSLTKIQTLLILILGAFISSLGIHALRLDSLYQGKEVLVWYRRGRLQDWGLTPLVIYSWPLHQKNNTKWTPKIYHGYN